MRDLFEQVFGDSVSGKERGRNIGDVIPCEKWLLSSQTGTNVLVSASGSQTDRFPFFFSLVQKERCASLPKSRRKAGMDLVQTTLLMLRWENIYSKQYESILQRDWLVKCVDLHSSQLCIRRIRSRNTSFLPSKHQRMSRMRSYISLGNRSKRQYRTLY